VVWFAGGTSPQRISPCLEVLDGFMRLSCPIVSSVVVAEIDAGSDGRATMVDCVSGIMRMGTMLLHKQRLVKMIIISQKMIIIIVTAVETSNLTKIG
jgi:hypothetical protein